MTLDAIDAATRERAETLTRMSGTARMGGFSHDVHTEWAVESCHGVLVLTSEDHSGWFTSRHEAERVAAGADRIIARRVFTAVSAPIPEES